MDIDIIMIEPNTFHDYHTKMQKKDDDTLNTKIQFKLDSFLNTYKDTFIKQDQLYNNQVASASHGHHHPIHNVTAKHTHSQSRQKLHPFPPVASHGNKKYISEYARPHWNDEKNVIQQKNSVFHYAVKERRRVGYGSEEQRFILSILNKISPSNGQKLKGKLISYCGDEQERIRICVHEIIHKCSGDIQFVSIYIDILKNLMITHEELVHTLVAKFIGDFVFSLPSRLMQIYGNITQDNNLTQFLRLKKDMYNDNKCICLLLVNNCTCIDPDQYLCHMKRIFDEVKMNTEIFDIFIHFVYDFFMYHVSHTMSSDSQSFVRVLFEMKDGECNKCTAFKLEDLVNLFRKNNNMIDLYTPFCKECST